MRLNAIAASIALALASSPAMAEDEFRLHVKPDNPPFSDVSSMSGGLVMEIARAAISQSSAPLPVQAIWGEPGAADEAYLPVVSADCEGSGAGNGICETHYVSDPLVELVVLLFVPASDARQFEQAGTLAGLKVCYERAEHPQGGEEISRTWLQSTTMDARGAPKLANCFTKLKQGEVDAVAADEYSGIIELFRLGLTDTVLPLTDPVGVEALHMTIPKTHWRATAHIYRVNAGLAALRRNGAYADIVARHTSDFWAKLKN